MRDEAIQALWTGDAPPMRDQEIALMRRHGMERVDLVEK
jgi:hypothetical protein